MNNQIRIEATAPVAIVGAGPIGLELGVSLQRAGVQTLHFDAQQIGYTISWWPRNTNFFSTTERIEIAGVPMMQTTQARATGEEYLAYLRGIVEQFNLQVHTYEPVIDIWADLDGFVLATQPQTGQKYYRCEKLVLAIGDMHMPNLLGIPGEDLAHVSHYFGDPHQYFRKRLLIVGGRNSAVEAALRCWRAGSRVAISYRRSEFDAQVIKHWILPDLLAQIELGNIQFYPQTVPLEIKPGSVLLQRADGAKLLHESDFVLLNTGFVQDKTLFESAGIELVGEFRAPAHNPETMETNVPGIYVAGTAVAGTQSRYRLFIENSHVHVGQITRALTGKWPKKLGTIPDRRYDLPLEDIQAN